MEAAILVGTALFLLFVLCARKFWIVYHRNQALTKLPVAGSLPWILGGRAWHIIRQLSRGQAGLVEIRVEGLQFAEVLGPILVG